MICARARALLPCLIWLAAACGDDSQVRRPRPPGTAAIGVAEAQGLVHTFDHVVAPPRDYYDALVVRTIAGLDRGDGLAVTQQALWVNFDGASVEEGFGVGQSFILCKERATIPPAPLTAAKKAEVLAMVEEFYRDAGTTLVVTAAEPGGGDFTTIHVGGAYGDLGCAGNDDALGMAPFDQGNANRNDVGFVFVPADATVRLVAETIAHEAGHAFGLEHVAEAKDFMYATTSSTATGFARSRVAGTTRIQDGPELLRQALGDASGGAGATPAPAVAAKVAATTAEAPAVAGFPPVAGSLPGLGQLATLGALLPGVASGGLDLSQLLPKLQALFPQGAGATQLLPGLDRLLTLLALASEAGARQSGVGSLPAGPIDPALAAAILQLQPGQVPLDLDALLELADQRSIDKTVEALQQLLATGGALGAPLVIGGTPVGPLPDLSRLLGLSPSGNVATMLSNLVATAVLINGHFTGADRDALLTLLKVAYLQQYLQLVAIVAP